MNRIINRSTKGKKRADYSKKRKNSVLYALAVISGLCLLGTIMSSILIIFVFTAFSSTLPSPTKLSNRSVEQSTKIHDRNGQLLYSVFDSKDRTLVKLENVSPHLINATLSAEDAEFYKHEGIDLFGIIRSVFVIVSGQGKQGGSTLTQQVAKNEKSWTGKYLKKSLYR